MWFGLGLTGQGFVWGSRRRVQSFTVQGFRAYSCPLNIQKDYKHGSPLRPMCGGPVKIMFSLGSAS